MAEVKGQYRYITVGRMSDSDDLVVAKLPQDATDARLLRPGTEAAEEEFGQP